MTTRLHALQLPRLVIRHRPSHWVVALFVAFAALVFTQSASAHDQRFPIEADRIALDTSQAPSQNTFSIQITDQDAILLTGDFDPTAYDSAILVYGTGASAGSTGLIELTGLWQSVADGFEYSAAESGPGGVTHISLKSRELSVSASGANWTFEPMGPQDELWFHFRVEETWLCARFSAESATLISNQAGNLEWTNSAKPIDCPQPLCGDGVAEQPFESCDDGNLIDDDSCSNSCDLSLCDTPEFDSTYEGIQAIIFDTCVGCHSPGTPSGPNLVDGFSFDAIVDVASPTFGVDMDYVEPGEPIASYLWAKLAANTFEDEFDENGALVRTAVQIVEDLIGRELVGAPMPVGSPIAPQHLEALERWIRAGAPRDLVVPETSDLLGACLPPADPLKLDPPPPLPAAGVGVQFQSTAWELLADSEDEVCYATYYDFTATDLVPEEAQFDCGGLGGVNNSSGKCFYWNRRVLRQDGQSHHSIIGFYNGIFDILYDDVICTNSDARLNRFDTPCSDDAFCDSSEGAADGTCEDRNLEWGPFQYRPNDPSDPKTGMSCDPKDIDPMLGFNPDCSGQLVMGVACTGFGPPDHTFQNFTFAGSQEPYTDDVYGNGVYAAIPMAGIITWNSHAFNGTTQDTTMAQYLDMHFALTPEEQAFPARGIFDANTIFIQRVPPFETREYCSTTTLAAGSEMREGVKVIDLSSHLHKRGVEFRIWEPPNEPCPPEFFVFSCEPDCECQPGEPDQLVYLSENYTDPTVVSYPTPVELGPTINERTYKFCAVYDNGSGASSTTVKRQSTSPRSPPFEVPGLGLIELGGPCPDLAFGQIIDGVKCMDGPNQAVMCGAEDAATFCETSPGLANGVCDACDLMGGFTTEDEMFIMLGTFFIDAVPEPSLTTLQLGALAALVALGRRRTRR